MLSMWSFEAFAEKLGGNTWVIGTVKGHGYQYNDTEP